MFNGENVMDGSYPHEAFTSDGTGGAYAGKITSATATDVTVPATANAAYVGAVLAVIHGAGQGQSLRVKSVSGHTYVQVENVNMQHVKRNQNKEKSIYRTIHL